MDYQKTQVKQFGSNPSNDAIFPDKFDPNDYLFQPELGLLTPVNSFKPLFKKVYKKKQSHTAKIQTKISEHNSPYLCTIHKVYQHPEKTIILMEYCPKKLREIKPEHPQFIEKILQISKGVQYLHNLDILHLDLKPQNVMISEDGTAKIIDYDVSQEAKTEGVLISQQIGTKGYIAPQMCSPTLSQFIIRKSADIWSLGALICSLMAKDQYNPTNMTQQQIISYIRELNCSQELSSLLQKMLQINPTQRSSIQQVISCLQQIKWKEDLLAANYTGTLQIPEGEKITKVHAFVIKKNTLLTFVKREWLKSINQFAILNRTYCLQSKTPIQNLQYGLYVGALLTVKQEGACEYRLDWHYPLLDTQEFSQSRLYLGKQFLEKVELRQGQLTLPSHLLEDNLIPGRPVIAESKGKKSLIGIYTGWFNVSYQPVVLYFPEHLRSEENEIVESIGQQQRMQTVEQRSIIIKEELVLGEAKIQPFCKLTKMIGSQQQLAGEITENPNQKEALLAENKAMMYAKDNQIEPACNEYEFALNYFRETDKEHTRSLNFQLGLISQSEQTLRRIIKDSTNQIKLLGILQMRLINMQIPKIKSEKDRIAKSKTLQSLTQRSLKVLEGLSKVGLSSNQFWILNCLDMINQIICIVSQFFWVTIKQCLEEDLGKKLRYYNPEQLQMNFEELIENDKFRQKGQIRSLHQIKQELKNLEMILDNSKLICRFDWQVTSFLDSIWMAHSAIADTLLDI